MSLYLCKIYIEFGIFPYKNYPVKTYEQKKRHQDINKHNYSLAYMLNFRRSLQSGLRHSRLQSLRFVWSRGRRNGELLVNDILRQVALETRMGLRLRFFSEREDEWGLRLNLVNS